MERKLAAILAADVVGYARLIGVDEAGTLLALRALRKELVQPTIERHHGRIVKLMGDGLLAEFPSVVEAVGAAVEIQSAAPERNSDLPEEKRVALRIGVNIGDIVVEDGDIFGEGVNVAARLETLSPPNGIAVSDTAHRELRGKLDIEFTDTGEHDLKNIASPVRAWLWSSEPQETTSIVRTRELETTDKPSIAVLPFVNIGGDAEQEHFADGLTEDLITALSQWRTFPVIARNSTYAYKNRARDVRRISQELGCHYLVEGSVRKSADRIRVSAQLIIGSTGSHLWAEKLDRRIEDIFDLQDDLTQRIAATIMPELEQSAHLTLHSGKQRDLDAWALLHRAIAKIYEHNPRGYAQERKTLAEVTAIDPGYARAHAWTAFSYIRDVLVGATKPSEEIWQDAITAARRAIALDDHDALAHSVLGLVYFRSGQHDLALAEQRRAMELNPNLVTAQFGLGQILAHVGRAQEGIVILERALLLNPRDPRRWNHLDIAANAHITAENYERAAQLANESSQRHPNGAMSRLYLTVALGNLGRVAEATSALATGLEIDPDIIAKHQSMRSQKYPADNKNFLSGLRAAGWAASAD